MTTCKLSEIISPAFYDVHRAIKSGGINELVDKGGRGSAKSSFNSVEIILLLLTHPECHAVVMRRYGNTLRTSVYAQICWAIASLGLTKRFKCTVSPMECTYLKTGQKIMFFGLDDPGKLKSIKVAFGYIGIAWFEELDQFNGPEQIRNVEQSLFRGGCFSFSFKSFNPPPSVRNWANQYARETKPGQLVHHSTYLTTPPAWLGPRFMADAEHLQSVNETAYRNEYLGEVTGTGGEVFVNVKLRTIEDDDIARFDNIRRGIDWGYAADPFAYNEGHYDKTRRRLYLYREYHKIRLSNRAAAAIVKPWAGFGRITCDSAEPKSIDEMKDYGLRVIGAKKGPDSVEYGIKWLQDLEEIIIDPARCPKTAREFTSYELERDKDGNFKAGFPDHDNHHIDAVRYACEDDMKRPGVKVLR